MPKEQFDFSDLAPAEIPVKYKSSSFLLVEATEDAARQYRNASVRGAKMDDGKLIGMGDVADVQSVLVAACLWELGQAGERLRLVPLTIVRAWPARVIKPLFNWVKEVSDLSETESADDLRKQRDAIQAKIDRLEAEETTPKN